MKIISIYLFENGNTFYNVATIKQYQFMLPNKTLEVNETILVQYLKFNITFEKVNIFRKCNIQFIDVDSILFQFLANVLCSLG